jgi:hypothetical protein
MLAVTMTTLSIQRGSLPCLLALSLASSLGACGGAAPVHTGYPEGEATPWEKAGKLNLNDSLEASAEGELSFPKRVRAKWYALDLPAPGKLTARLSTEPTVKGSDVGFEILDAGFNVNAEAINDDDVGQPKKTREYKDARQGKSYIHIYTLGRDDVVGYTLRVHFDPKPQARVEAPMEPATADRTTFPWTVPNLPALPQIGKGGGGGSTVVTRETPPPPPDPNAGFNLIKATITEFSDTGNGVRIILNKGQNASLDGGLDGDVLSGGKPLPSGHFKLRSCKQDECDAVVPKATMDQIQANRAVIVKVPK